MGREGERRGGKNGSGMFLFLPGEVKRVVVEGGPVPPLPADEWI
jgi:hypothetical protein